jgi:hypothetical protein
LKAGLTRCRRYTGDELVAIIVAWFVARISANRTVRRLRRSACTLAQPGLRSLADVDAAIAQRVRRRSADVLAT